MQGLKGIGNNIFDTNQIAGTTVHGDIVVISVIDDTNAFFFPDFMGNAHDVIYKVAVFWIKTWHFLFPFGLYRKIIIIVYTNWSYLV